MTQKTIAFEFGISISTGGNLAANAYKKLGVHGAAAAVHAHRDAHFYCGTRAISGLSASASRRAARHRLALFLEREAAEKSGLAGLLSTKCDPRYVETHVR